MKRMFEFLQDRYICLRLSPILRRKAPAIVKSNEEMIWLFIHSAVAICQFMTSIIRSPRDGMGWTIAMDRETNAEFARR